MWDKRGTGLSDPVNRVPTLDERMDDLHAVLDSAEVDCPALLGISEGGPMSILFAAMFPDHVRSLVLYGAAARFTQELPDFPWGWSPDQVRRATKMYDKHWGEGVLTEIVRGSSTDVPGLRELWGRYERASASPAMAAMLMKAATEIDVRKILHTVKTNTLVLARPGDQVVAFEASEALAAAMPNAVFRALPSGAHGDFDIDDSLARRSGAAWLSTSARGSVRWRDLTKCSRVAQSAISQRARDCASKAWARIASRALPRKLKSSGSLRAKPWAA